ncbi:MAG: ADP-ribosylglycohydrolase family protein [Kiloniellales bacterium]
MAATPSSADRFVGCLIGQCLGDALGFVVEGYPPEVCRHYVDTVLRAGKAGEHARAPFLFGQYSDDSQLAREMLSSFVACGRFEPADYAARIAAIFAEDRIVGRGRATEAAARRLAAGVPWQEAGTPPPQAGNGSAMRAGAAGLIAAGADPDRLIRVAHDQGRITHADRRCSAGAVCVAGAVWQALNGGPARLPKSYGPSPEGYGPQGGGQVDRPGWLDWLAARSQPFDRTFAGGVRALAGWLELPPEAAEVEIARVGIEPGFSDRWLGISPFVTTSVLWSLYAFFRSPDDYWETICTAIAVGGDVDTTAAMAGAISGAHNGRATVPPALAARLTDQGTWGHDALVELALSAHRLATGAAD